MRQQVLVLALALAWPTLGQLPLPVPSSHYRLTINLS